MRIELWEIDSSLSSISFAVRHLVLSKTRGRFNRWRGTVTVPDGDLTRAAIDVVIYASSIDTGVARRDAQRGLSLGEALSQDHVHRPPGWRRTGWAPACSRRTDDQ